MSDLIERLNMLGEIAGEAVDRIEELEALLAFVYGELATGTHTGVYNAMDAIAKEALDSCHEGVENG